MNTGNIYIDNGIQKFAVDSTSKVVSNDKLIMIFPGGKQEELNIKIEADFKNIKPEHHEIFLQSFASKYNRHTHIYNTHTNHDGTKVPIVKGKQVERTTIWQDIGNSFKIFMELFKRPQ